MTKIQLGKREDGEEIFYNYIPFDSRGITIMAATRSGKSTLIFELKKRFKNCEIKPQIVSLARDSDEFRQRDEIPFIIIGDYGEIPINVKLAKQMGENVRKMNLDVIVDINSLKTEKEQDEFISAFLTGLQLNGQEKFWKRPCILFIDEVQILCKQGTTNFPKSRDAIAILAQTCLKKNILSIVASHAMRDFYINARQEFSNHIVGFLDNPDQREFACKLLDTEQSNAQIIRELRNSRGKFFVEGSDIVNNAVTIQVEATKIYPKGEVIIPKLDLESVEKAKGLLDSLKSKDQLSVESQLRFDLAEEKNRNDKLSLTQADPTNLERIDKEGEAQGWNLAMQNAFHIIQNGEKSLFGIRKSHLVKIVTKTDGRKMVILE